MMEEADDGLRVRPQGAAQGPTPSPSSCSPASTGPWACSIGKDEEMVPVDEFVEKPVDPAALVAKVDGCSRGKGA